MRVLITGGTGSLGSQLTRHWLAQGHRVQVLSRDAHKQAELARALRAEGLGECAWFLGDITDSYAVQRAIRGCDTLVHAAAQKRIERGESDPDEYLRINVLGTQIVVRAALQEGVQRCLFISTDKAVAPLNFYGCSKALAERLWLHQGTAKGDGPHFAALRYGNVVASRGSVWHLWQEQLKSRGAILVREPEPTRFIVDFPQAISFVEQALGELEHWGQMVLVPGTLKAFSLWELADELAPRYCWERQPLGPGEKQHEIMLAEGEWALHTTEDLWLVTSQLHTMERGPFSSATAPRLTGAELIEKLSERGDRRGDHSRGGVQLVAP